MSDAKGIPSDIAFTAAVKASQSRHGSRTAYAAMEQGVGWATAITAELAAFIAEQTSIFLATANTAGQPYIQHRGGPPGFLRVLDASTLAFADYSGNRQYISVGNLADNAKVHVFLLDYVHRQRVKIWGEATVIDDDVALLASLTPSGYGAPVERAIIIRVATWDANCTKHIPQRFEAASVAAAVALRDARIAELEAQVQALRSKVER